MAYRTLGELRSLLRTRLGFSGAGAAAGVIVENLNSIIQEAQVALYWTHEWARLRKYSDKTLGVNQFLLDYPTDCNPERIRAISYQDGTIWSPPIEKGITPQHYTTQGNTAPPHRWEPYAQIEFWPKNNVLRTVRIFYVKNLLQFTLDADEATIDDNLILQLSLADGKGNYRHPDAANYKARAESLLVQLKTKNWGQTKFNPNDYAEDPLARPVVV